MNKAASKRLISKQEAVVLLGDMKLFHCTETIDMVSISSSNKISSVDNTTSNSTMMNKYKRRPPSLEHMSLYQYYHHTKNNGDKCKRDAKIPHFVGISGAPTFPVTIEYAKHALIVHKPWRKYPTSADWIRDFNIFINSPDAPISAKMTYQRVHTRWLSKMEGYDPVADVYDTSRNPIDLSNSELLELVGLHKNPDQNYDSIFNGMDRGISFKWDKQAKVRKSCKNQTDSKIPKNSSICHKCCR
jgi:hypothetical protein